MSSSNHRSPSPANRPLSTHFGSGRTSGVVTAAGGRIRLGAAEGGGWDNPGCDVPPPLPARNRSLNSHNSSPLLLPSSGGEVAVQSGSGSVVGSPPPPPLPPRNPSSASSSSCSSSSSGSFSSSATHQPGMPDVVPPNQANGASQLLQNDRRTPLQPHDSPTSQTSSQGVSRTTKEIFSHMHPVVRTKRNGVFKKN